MFAVCLPATKIFLTLRCMIPDLPSYEGNIKSNGRMYVIGTYRSDDAGVQGELC